MCSLIGFNDDPTTTTEICEAQHGSFARTTQHRLIRQHMPRNDFDPSSRLGKQLACETLALSAQFLHLYEQPFDITTLSAPDGSVTAKFVSFGATLTELWVKDRDGKARDIVLGYDNNVRF